MTLLRRRIGVLVTRHSAKSVRKRVTDHPCDLIVPRLVVCYGDLPASRLYREICLCAFVAMARHACNLVKFVSHVRLSPGSEL
jgi:hypothetical protein